MDAKTKAMAGAVGIALVTALVVARVEKKPERECVIPKCDKSEKEVDCYETLSRPPDRKPLPYWVGCNVFPKELATGKQCLPAACIAEEKKPRELK